jgi:hypothetical protein
VSEEKSAYQLLNRPARVQIYAPVPGNDGWNMSAYTSHRDIFFAAKTDGSKRIQVRFGRLDRRISDRTAMS